MRKQLSIYDLPEVEAGFQPGRSAGIGDGDDGSQLAGEGLCGLENLRGAAAAADGDDVECV